MRAKALFESYDRSEAERPPFHVTVEVDPEVPSSLDKAKRLAKIFNLSLVRSQDNANLELTGSFPTLSRLRRFAERYGSSYRLVSLGQAGTDVLFDQPGF